MNVRLCAPSAPAPVAWIVAVGLAGWSAMACAWDTPREAVERFVAFDADGGRLSSARWHAYLADYLHAPPGYDEPGWDAVLAIEDYAVGEPDCRGDACTVRVTYRWSAVDGVGDAPNRSRGASGAETFVFRVIRRAGEWKLAATPDYPRVFAAGAANRVAPGSALADASTARSVPRDSDAPAASVTGDAGVATRAAAASPPLFPLTPIPERVSVEGPVTFEVVHGETSPRYRLVIRPGDRDVVVPTDLLITLLAQRDFNGDGTSDALVATTSGGNCCPETHQFVTVYAGVVHVAAIDDAWGEVAVDDDGTPPRVRQKTVAQTTYWRLDGTTAVPDGSVPALAAWAEIHGEPGMAEGVGSSKTLRADIDGDGRPEAIVCAIWPRWGALDGCALPLPDGGVQALAFACQRLGVLARVHSGRHALVCDNDTVIVFDGERWRTDAH